MTKRVIVSTILGGITMILWTFVVNGILGFRVAMDMKQLKDERAVYEVLKEHVTEPGRYACNPAPEPGRGYPEGEPAFSILYGGVGHEAAGMDTLIHLILVFVIVFLASFLLSRMSPAVLSRYGCRVLVFTGFGLLIALFSDLGHFGIADYPLKDALIIGLHNVVMWTVVGLVVAWRLKPLDENREPA